MTMKPLDSATAIAAKELNMMEFCSTYVRHSLRGLSKAEAYHRMRNIVEEFEKKYDDKVRTSGIPLDSNKSKAKRECLSVDGVVNENEKYLQEECQKWESEMNNNIGILKMVESCDDEKCIETVSYQNKMIELRDHLSAISQYKEEELNTKINELQKEKEVILFNNTFQSHILAAKQNFANNSVRENADHLLKFYKNCTTRSLKEVKSLELKVTDKE